MTGGGTTVLRRVRARFGDGADRGISLAELIVAMMVFGLVITIVSGTFVSLTRATSQASTVDANTRVASNGLAVLARTLRGARTVPVAEGTALPAFVEAKPESVTFYTAVNLESSTSTRPRRVQFVLGNDRSLLERSTTATLDAASNPVFGATASSRTITAPLAVRRAGDAPLFTYLGINGTPVPVDAAGAVATADLPLITAVQISISVDRTTTMTSQGVTLRNRVGLPNLQRGATT